MIIIMDFAKVFVIAIRQIFLKLVWDVNHSKMAKSSSRTNKKISVDFFCNSSQGTEGRVRVPELKCI